MTSRIAVKRSLRFVLSLLASLSFLVVVMPATDVSALANGSVELTGHGYGHGRGMGQYGALGYAIDESWSHSTILNHYYSNTHAGSISNPTIGVWITEEQSTEVLAIASNTYSVNGNSVAGNTAVRVYRLGENSFQIMTAPSCGGPWTNWFTASGTVTVSPPSATPGDTRANMIQRCTTFGTRTYRGALQAIEDTNAHVLRTVNSVAMEDYLRGVVPRESPASWGDLGGGKGIEALKAQSVAARSYAWAENRYNYARTCDTTSCQVYEGAFWNSVAKEDSRTNNAISATAGEIRLMSNNTTARTEFSSSTGGYTAGGTFPAVVDNGDDVSNNPNHTWTASVSASSIQSQYPQIGTLQTVAINSRNGLGDMGGRVTLMTLSGSNGSVSISGDTFRIAFGLKSNWFRVGGVASGGTGGYWIAANDGGIFSFGNAQFYGSTGGMSLNKPVVNMEATANDAGYWLVASDGGIFSFGNAQFYGSTGAMVLNKPVVGMARTPDSGGYWLVATDGGIFSFGNAPFYGSTGAMVLNKPVVGMAPTPTGRGYWLVASDGGIFSFGDAQFYGSTGGMVLNRPIVGMATTSTGSGYWLVASDGGIFSFGDAPFYGSGANTGSTFSGMERTRDGGGYMLISNRGAVFAYGDAPDFGGVPSVVPGYSNTALSIRGTAD